MIVIFFEISSQESKFKMYFNYDVGGDRNWIVCQIVCQIVRWVDECWLMETI